MLMYMLRPILSLCVRVCVHACVRVCVYVCGCETRHFLPNDRFRWTHGALALRTRILPGCCGSRQVSPLDPYKAGRRPKLTKRSSNGWLSTQRWRPSAVSSTLDESDGEPPLSAGHSIQNRGLGDSIDGRNLLLR